MTTTKLFDWPNVRASHRPRDTGRRTEHGHRIISRPGFPGDCIEFPYNSGQLIARVLYPMKLERAAQDAAPDMLAALRLVRQSTEWSCMEASTQNAVEAAIAIATGDAPL